MSQFRIKHIDEGMKDEWVFRLNEDGAQLGDDIDARDPNELAEAIIDIQEVLLKTSSLAAAAILKPNSGLAERLTILEATAGEATLQDIYENGNYISILSGRPLVLGAREEIKIDDAGNLSFKPVTMRVKGTGTAYLELSNQALFSSLGDLLVGAVSPGNNLFLKAGGNVSFQDNYLTNPVTLSQSGDSQLDTTSQSLVGAINELKSSTFNVSFQSVYTQSTPPKITTSIASGPIVIEDGNAASLGDTFKVIGNATVTKKLTAGSAKIGNNTTIVDNTGLVTSDKIKTLSELQAVKLNSELNELTFQDKRITVPLSQNTHSTLHTNNSSIIGAINELKSNIDSVGGAVTSYDHEHVPSTGEHGIITTKAALGQDSAPRFIVYNNISEPKFSVTGAGHVEADSMVISGLNVVTLLNLLNAHLVDDGTSHSALSTHLSASNPHNTVRRLQGLPGDINLSSLDGSITFTPSGQTINMSAVDLSTLQSVYDKPAVKEVKLTTLGLKYLDSVSNAVLHIEEDKFTTYKDIFFADATRKVKGAFDLTVDANESLKLTSQTDNIYIHTVDTNKAVVLQGVPFDEAGAKTIPVTAGTSVLGAIKKTHDDKYTIVNHTMRVGVLKGQTITIDRDGRTWFPITTIHPANQFVAGVNFYFSNLSNLYTAAETVDGALVAGVLAGTFQKTGFLTADLGVGLDSWEENHELYLGARGYSDWEILNLASIANGTTVTVDPTQFNFVITGVTGTPSVSSKQFKIENTGSPNLDADKTRENIVALLNDFSILNPEADAAGGFSTLYPRATIDGESARGSLLITAPLSVGNLIQITPGAGMVGTTTTLTAVAETTTPNNTQFRVGTSIQEAAYNIAEAINRTTFYKDVAQLNAGHYCYAEVVGTMIRLTYYKPGFSARNINITTDTANITISQFAGGTCKVRLYRQDFDSVATPITSSNPSALSVTSLSADESTTQYILGSRAKSSKRRKLNEVPTRVGIIEDVAGTNVKFRIR